MAVWLAGCTSTPGRYPSLALREFETRPAEPDATAINAAPQLVQPADSAEIAAIKQAAETAFAGFARKQAGTAALVRRARGQSADSNLRSEAVVALADLSTQRSAIFLQLAELDLLAAESAIAYKATQQVDAARTAVAAMIAEQDKVLAALWAEMGQ